MRVKFVSSILLNMSQDQSQISLLYEKIQQLLSVFDSQDADIERLTGRVKELEGELDLKVSKISELQKNYEDLKTAKTIAASGNDTHETKIKINKIVREIDRCISLLNQ